MPTALGATPSRLPSRWKSCCFVAIRKSWTPTSRTDDPGRFARSRMLGANFGLTPGKYQSAEADVTGAISRVATSHIDRIRPNPSKLLQRGVIRISGNFWIRVYLRFETMQEAAGAP